MPVRRLTPWAPESDLSYIGRFRAYQDRYFQPVPGADSPNSPTEVGNPGPDDGTTINRSADVEMTGLEESSGEAEGAVPSVNVPAATQPDVEMAGLEESSGEAEGAGPSVNGPAATQPEVQAAGPEEGSGEAERAAPSASGPATTTPAAQASGERVSGEWPEQDVSFPSSLSSSIMPHTHTHTHTHPKLTHTANAFTARAHPHPSLRSPAVVLGEDRRHIAKRSAQRHRLPSATAQVASRGRELRSFRSASGSPAGAGPKAPESFPGLYCPVPFYQEGWGDHGGDEGEEGDEEGGGEGEEGGGEGEEGGDEEGRGQGQGQGEGGGGG